MRHNNYYNKLMHKDLSNHYFFQKSRKQSFKKLPVLRDNNRSTRLLVHKKNQLRRFVYTDIRPKRDKRRL